MSDDDVLAAFRLFLEGAGRPGDQVRDRAKVLAALDVLDPEFAEELTKRWEQLDARTAGGSIA